MKEVRPFEEERLGWMAATFESVSDLVFIADLEDRFIYINPAALNKLGYRKEEMLGRTAEMIMAPSTKKNREDILRKTLGSPFCWQGEVSNLKKDGSLFTAHLKTALVRNKRGEPIGMVGIERDITEKKMQERLAAIGALTAGLSHEIGNPLASISSLVQLLKRKLKDPKVQESFDLMNTHIQRISNIITSVSSFSKKNEPELMAVNLKPVIQTSLQRVCLERNDKFVEINTSLSESLPRVKAEASQLSKVFYQIFMNAFDAIDQKGKLIIQAEAMKKRVRISVQDTGCGMSKDQIEKIFEPFYTTKEVNEGKGLGLSMSYGIIKSFGGEIEVESTLNEGSRFSIWLPMYHH